MRSSLQNFRKLALALALASVFMVIEIAGGIYAHSLAIITDAAHLLSDVSGFAVSLLVAFYVSQASAQTFSYGYHRMEVSSRRGAKNDGQRKTKKRNFIAN